jgi:outer membrane cobalamin receptor
LRGRGRQATLARALATAMALFFGASHAAEQQQAGAEPQKPKQEQAPRFSDEVVVTATRAERAADEAPLSASVLGSREVQEAAALTPDDLLRNVPGINLPLLNSNQLFPSENLLSIRGIGGGRALVTLDGVPLNDAFFGNIQWNKVPLQGVDHIELTRGGGSSLFGNYSMGGTIDISTRPPQGRALTLDTLLGSHDTRRFDAAFSGRTGARSSLSVGANYFDTEGAVLIPLAERDVVLDLPESARAFNARVRFDRQGERTAGWLRASYHDDDLSSGTPVAGTEQRIFDAAGRLHVGLGDAGGLSGSASYQRQTLEVDNSVRQAPGVEFLANHHDLPIDDLGLSLEWHGKAAPRRPWLSAGADVRALAGDDAIQNFSPAGAPGLLQTVGGRQRFFGLFAQAGVTVSRLEIMASARADHWRNTDGYDRRSTTGEARFDDKRTTQLNPRLALRYAAGGGTNLRAALYRAFRAPTLNELYRPIAARTFEVVPNAQLGPEVMLGGDLGIDLRKGRARGQLNAFVAEVEDLISRKAVAFAPRVTFNLENLGLNRSRGVEAFGSFELTRRFTLAASYTFTDSTIADNPQDRSIEGNLVPAISRHAAAASVRFRSASGLAANLRGRHMSRQYGDTANLLPVDPHTVLDVFVSVPVGKTLELYAIGENLLDETYVAENRGARRLGMPRQLSVGVRVRVLREPQSD